MSTPEPAGAAATRKPPFKLLRFFSLTSLVGIAVVTAALIATYRELTVRHLVDHEGRANAALTQAFANVVWDRYRLFVLGSAGRSREALLADPSLATLRADVLTKMRGLQVAKIKIYNLAGVTVFSTDQRQIGEDKSKNAGFLSARDGEVVSNITYREKFDAFEGVISNRDLIASYVPVRSAANAPVEGVFEVYSDVTELLQIQRRAQWQVAGIVFALLALLYLFLHFVVRRADRTIARQEQERTVAEERVRHQAYHDALTGLPNRAYFAERLAESILLAERHGHHCALMFIDLDRFKIVNDSLGHDAGDELLRTVAGRLQASLRDSDLLFRMGGDEFTVILPHIAAPEDAALVARRLHDVLISPIPVHEHELTVGATIGIAVYPDDGERADVLLKNADAAMYSAKQRGRGGHAFYRGEMNQRAMQRLDLEAALRKGFRDGEFTLHYQPRMATASRRVVAVEALLRWNSPSRGMVPPGDFIDVLEDTGLMLIVGEWVLRSACGQASRWQQAGMETLRVSVNVSALQFQGANFVAMVERVLADTGVPPGLVELELTESMLIENIEHARRTIDRLRGLGLRIAIDDFGTGYSSLNYLRHFQVDYLKIDRSFVTDIASNPRDRAVAVAITELARALGMTVVAEGVETSQQAAFFSSIHCGELQGFLFSKALPVDRLEVFLAQAPGQPQTEASCQASALPLP
jgi:diguanylate cyclase (GGDEF)-like protein